MCSSRKPQRSQIMSKPKTCLLHAVFAQELDSYPNGFKPRSGEDLLMVQPWQECWREDLSTCLPKNHTMHEFTIVSPLEMVNNLWIQTIKLISILDDEMETHAKMLGIPPPNLVNNTIPRSYFALMDELYGQQVCIAGQGYVPRQKNCCIDWCKALVSLCSTDFGLFF